MRPGLESDSSVGLDKSVNPPFFKLACELVSRKPRLTISQKLP